MGGRSAPGGHGPRNPPARPGMAAGAALALLLAGCSQQDEGAPAASAGGGPAPLASSEAASAGASAQEAVDFLSSRLNKIDLSHSSEDNGVHTYSWELTSLALSQRQWQWGERYRRATVDLGGAVDTSNAETYSLDPSQLTYPTSVEAQNWNGNDVWAVVFECRTSDCISVAGTETFSSHLAYGDPEPDRVTSIDERRESNSWPFRDEATAKRAAKAMDAIIAAAGGRQSAF